MDEIRKLWEQVHRLRTLLDEKTIELWAKLEEIQRQSARSEYVAPENEDDTRGWG